MMKTFLKPGWVLLLLFVIAFSYFAFTVLAPWQLGKDDQIVERNEHITEAYEQDPRPVDEVLDAKGSIVGDEWSRAILKGKYLPEDEVLLRLRPASTGPSYQSLVPFHTDSGLIILVNRGWVEAEEGNAVPDIPRAPSDEVTIVGMVRKAEAVHQSAPIFQEGYEQVYSINPPQVGELTGVAMGQDYLQLSDEEPGVLNPMPVPQLERGNHLSYGYQWIAFGIMAPLGLGYFVWSELKERRLARAEKLALEASTDSEDTEDTEDTEDSAAVAAGSAVPPVQDTGEHAPQPSAAEEGADAGAAPSRRSRARYGSSKPDFYSKLRDRNRERF
ncbi:SURF1 family cytochrome oxidase biogenesis protein [Corynebacterium flavescens]|uniref:SURF1 family cytochrome oxidase biogenesis protein n=1 Tax=Corynebacterium flavescens TaxID=28028 RepID=UPI003FD6B640